MFNLPQTHRRLNRWLYIIIVSTICVYVMYVFVKNIRQSLFFAARDRINVVIYGKDTAYYSVGVLDNVDYMVPFYSDLKIRIPGGYGYYRVGAIGKLVTLERQPVIFRRAFSAATSTLVDLYFYPKTVELYYGNNEPAVVSKPTTQQIFWLNSNASVFDRIYLAFLLGQKRERDFKLLSNLKITAKSGDDWLREDEFTKNYLGFFYQNIYRTDKKNIQIIYAASYSTADRLGKMLEGSGIRVSDISYSVAESNRCAIIESEAQFSTTAQAMSAFFGCPLKTGRTDIYDILFILGEKEKEWEVE